MLQPAVVRCNMLSHTATHVDVLWTWTYLHVVNLCGLICNALQYTAKHCRTLQHIATHIDVLSTWRFLHVGSPLSVMLQYNTTHYNTLQHIATHIDISSEWNILLHSLYRQTKQLSSFLSALEILLKTIIFKHLAKHSTLLKKKHTHWINHSTANSKHKLVELNIELNTRH